jgi:hypothetical protein
MFSCWNLSNLTLDMHGSDTSESLKRIISFYCLFKIEKNSSNFGVDEAHLILKKILDKIICPLWIKPNLGPRFVIESWWRNVVHSRSVVSLINDLAIVSIRASKFLSSMIHIWKHCQPKSQSAVFNDEIIWNREQVVK